MFHKWVKSDFNYKQMQSTFGTNHTIHNTLIQKLDNKNRTSRYSMHMNKLNLKRLEFPMKVKDMPKFENLNNLNVNVFELNGTVLTPIHTNTNYDQPQIDLLLFESQYCLIPKLHCLINKNSHKKWVCRRCLTAFSSEDILNQHLERCQKQQPTNILFS